MDRNTPPPIDREGTGPVDLHVVGSRPETAPVHHASGRFLGLEPGAWTKMIFALLIASVITIGTWAMLVRDDLKSLNITQEHHDRHGHDDTATSIDEIQRVQLIQGIKLESIEDGIEDIKAQLEVD